MCRRALWGVLVVVTFAGVGLGYAAASADLSAIGDPGRLEMMVAIHVREVGRLQPASEAN